MRVLFWGTPEFATTALRALLGEGHDVVAVVTQPDRPRGRSRSLLVPSPVKRIAIDEGLPVFQPEKPRGAEFVHALRPLAPDISVVVAYGRLLPLEVIDLPPRGTINIHASLLPLLRGASPIEAAILAGHAETGITIIRMVLALDAGPMILRARTPIGPDETGGDLRARLSEMGAEALIEALTLIATDQATEEPQDDARATRAQLITREAARIDWTHDALTISRLIRAYDPKPGAFTARDGLEVKLFGGRLGDGAGRPGEVLAIDGDDLLVACATGAVRIGSVLPAGRKRLTPREWAAGRGVSVGDILG